MIFNKLEACSFHLLKRGKERGGEERKFQEHFSLLYYCNSPHQQNNVIVR